MSAATMTWVRAIVAWTVCFVGAALALELLVLGMSTGNWSAGLAAMIAVAACVALAGAAGVWRFIAGGRGRPQLAGAFIAIAAAWAGLGAFVMAWLLVAFRS